jgi:hypothetical protein
MMNPAPANPPAFPRISVFQIVAAIATLSISVAVVGVALLRHLATRTSIVQNARIEHAAVSELIVHRLRVSDTAPTAADSSDLATSATVDGVVPGDASWEFARLSRGQGELTFFTRQGVKCFVMPFASAVQELAGQGWELVSTVVAEGPDEIWCFKRRAPTALDAPVSA